MIQKLIILRNSQKIPSKLCTHLDIITWHLDGINREWNNLEIPGFAIDERYLEGDHDHEEEEHEEGEEHHDEEEHEEEFVFIDMERTRYDLNGEWRDIAPWAETVKYSLSYTDYTHAEIEGNGEIGTKFSNESLSQRLQITHTDTPERHGVVGLQYSNEEFSAIGEESFIPKTEIDSTGLFLV